MAAPKTLIFAHVRGDIRWLDDDLQRAIHNREAVVATDVHHARGMIPERIIVLGKPRGIEWRELDAEIAAIKATAANDISVEYR